MSLLDVLNRLNEEGNLELGEKEIRDASITKNGIDKQSMVNGIEPELANNKSTKNKNQDGLQDESNLLADILDPTSTPTAQEIGKKIRTFAKKSETKYLNSRLKNHSIKPKEYNEYLKNYLNQPRNDNQNTNISKDQDDNLVDTDSNDEDIFTLSSWQKEIVEGQNINIKSIKSEYLEVKSKEFAKMNTHIPIFSNDFIKQVVSYCISQNPDGTPNMKFWAAELFQYLIEKNFLSNNYVRDGIVKAFIERESWGVLKLAIIHVSDIPEKDLVYLLRYLISNCSSFSKQPISNLEKKKTKKEKEKEKPSIENFFALIICAPRSDSKMMEALKDLNEDELFYIVQILCKWIEKHDGTDIIPEIIPDTALIEAHGKYEFSSKKAAALKKTKYIPDLHFVIDFLSLTFDIHFRTFILSKKMQPLITRLSNLVTYELAMYESLESMRGCLALFHQKRQRVEGKQRSEKLDSVKQSKDSRKNNDWLNDGDVTVYSVELFSFFGEESEESEDNNFRLDEMNIYVDEYGVENELDSDDDTNKEQERMPDID